MGVCYEKAVEVCVYDDSNKAGEFMKIVEDQSSLDESNSNLNIEGYSKELYQYDYLDSNFTQHDDIGIDSSLNEIISLKYELLNFKLSKIMSTSNQKVTQSTKSIQSQSIERKPAYIDNKKAAVKETSERDGYDEFENEEYLPCDDTINPDNVLLAEIMKEILNLKHEIVIDEICKKMHFINVIKDFVLFNKKVDFFFVIISGSIGYFKDNILQSVYKKGETFGDLSHLNEDKVYDGASVYSNRSSIKWCLKALEDSKIFIIDTKLLNNIIKKNSNKILHNLDIIETIPVLRNVSFENKLFLADKVVHQTFVMKDTIQSLSEDVKFIFVINQGVIVGKNKFGETQVTIQKGEVLNGNIIYSKIEESKYHYVVNSEKCSITSLSINSIAEIFSIKFEEKLLFEVFCRAVEENLFLSKMLRDNKGLKSSSKMPDIWNLKKMRTNSFNQILKDTNEQGNSVDLASSNIPFQRPLQKFYTKNFNHQPSKTLNKLDDPANENEVKLSRRESNNQSIHTNALEYSNTKSRYLKANLSGSFHSININRSILSDSKLFIQNSSEKKELFELFHLKIIKKSMFSIQKIKDEKLMYLILYGEILDVSFSFPYVVE